MDREKLLVMWKLSGWADLGPGRVSQLYSMVLKPEHIRTSRGAWKNRGSWVPLPEFLVQQVWVKSRQSTFLLTSSEVVFSMPLFWRTEFDGLKASIRTPCFLFPRMSLNLAEMGVGVLLAGEGCGLWGCHCWTESTSPGARCSLRISFDVG